MIYTKEFKSERRPWKWAHGLMGKEITAGDKGKGESVFWSGVGPGLQKLLGWMRDGGVDAWQLAKTGAYPHMFATTADRSAYKLQATRQAYSIWKFLFLRWKRVFWFLFLFQVPLFKVPLPFFQDFDSSLDTVC